MSKIWQNVLDYNRKQSTETLAKPGCKGVTIVIQRLLVWSQAPECPIAAQMCVIGYLYHWVPRQVISMTMKCEAKSSEKLKLSRKVMYKSSLFNINYADPNSSFHFKCGRPAVSIMFATAAQRCAVEAHMGAIGCSGVLLQQKHPGRCSDGAQICRYSKSML